MSAVNLKNRILTSASAQGCCETCGPAAHVLPTCDLFPWSENLCLKTKNGNFKLEHVITNWSRKLENSTFA